MVVSELLDVISSGREPVFPELAFSGSTVDSSGRVSTARFPLSAEHDPSNASKTRTDIIVKTVRK